MLHTELYVGQNMNICSCSAYFTPVILQSTESTRSIGPIIAVTGRDHNINNTHDMAAAAAAGCGC